MTLKSKLPQFIRYTMLVVALVGLLVSLIAPGWWLALPFVILFAYLWRFGQFSLAQRGHAQTPTPPRRTEPENYRSLEWKGLIFRSESEIKIAKTLDHRGIFFIPPCRVRLNRGREERMTRELDFVICYGGKWGILEVDGPFHNAKADAERDKLLLSHGIASIQRFPSLRCFQEPQSVIDDFLRELG